MIQRLQAQLLILFTAFVLLVIVSVGVTYWGVQTQQRDALLVNLAGRQRMLAQQMTRLALQSQKGDESAADALQESRLTFQQTLSALRNGGSAPYLTEDAIALPVTRDPQTLAALDGEEAAWNRYRAALDALAPPTEAGAASLQTTLEAQTSDLVKNADLVVRRYEAVSAAKLNRLRIVQVTFLACALALLATGAWITRRSLLRPLQSLGFAAKRLGENDLDTPVRVEGPVEMRALSQAFDEMRSRLRAARQELVRWNVTLEQRVARRTRELETLNEVSREI
ncbi:MAG: type IV pili methyl-accepting chemotaxis transducer N-terminal domain-containing protein, partial [Anaerolineales bacterium]|nr:type IV pili methyl-accepting chemotaxis transducer N-terminal domain-containing protein [Anaerolineales bacterium]